MTGETGAGKSIIIDAVELLTGGRGSVEFVRYGSSKAEIEGLFTIEDLQHPIFKKGSQLGIDVENEDGMIILSRTITSSGKSICRVNGKLVTLAILRELGKSLIDIHSQHETQSLMDSERHIELLDLYNRGGFLPVLDEYNELYSKLESLKKRYTSFSENEKEMAQRLDLLKFQLNEIQAAELNPSEDEQLVEERNKLINFERIFQGLQDAYQALYGEQKALDWLSMALNGLETAGEHDEDVKSKKEEFSNHYYLIEEMTYEIRNQLDQLEFDPERLNMIESRLNEIQKLKKKYGQSVSEIVDYAVDIEEEIDQIENRDSHLSRLKKEIKELAHDTYLEAEQLHGLRKEAATQLTEAILQELKDLYLEKASFAVDIQKRQAKEADVVDLDIPVHLNAHGFDMVKFLITTNPGEPLKEIGKVASGGELSRIMLALKKIFSKHQGVTSVIFDEVDTGVSGRVAQAIAEKIHGISAGSQVLCITHLPQVASMADTHLLIEKRVDNDRTSTELTELSHDMKVEEIGRMITGTEMTETTKQHAKELLSLAHKFKESHQY